MGPPRGHIHPRRHPHSLFKGKEIRKREGHISPPGPRGRLHIGPVHERGRLLGGALHGPGPRLRQGRQAEYRLRVCLYHHGLHWGTLRPSQEDRRTGGGVSLRRKLPRGGIRRGLSDALYLLGGNGLLLRLPDLVPGGKGRARRGLQVCNGAHLRRSSAPWRYRHLLCQYGLAPVRRVAEHGARLLSRTHRFHTERRRAAAARVACRRLS